MERDPLTLSVTITGDKKAIRNSICPSSERGIGFRAAYLTKFRKL